MDFIDNHQVRIGEKDIKRSSSYTWQEQWIFGSSTGEETTKAKIIPEGIFEGGYSIMEMQKAREEFKYFLNNQAAVELGFDNSLAVFTMEPLNEKGEAIRDPQIVGILRRDGFNFDGVTPIEEVPGRSLTEEYYNYMREHGLKFPWREIEKGKETEQPSKLEGN